MAFTRSPDQYQSVSVPRDHRLYALGRRTIPKHLLIAEAALGHPLPDRAVVHHHDGDRYNNSNTNLVICEDQSYHRLLHRRMQEMFPEKVAAIKKRRRKQMKAWQSNSQRIAEVLRVPKKLRA